MSLDQFGQSVESRLQAALEELVGAVWELSRLQLTWAQTHPEDMPGELMDVFGQCLALKRRVKELAVKYGKTNPTN